MDNVLRLTSSADTLAAVPYLIGYHPKNSVVVLGMRREGQCRGIRADLPLPDGSEGDIAGQLARDGSEMAVIAGYGPEERVAPAVMRLREALDECGITVQDALRTEGGRYWTYLRGCPPDGIPFDPSSSRIAAQATVAGLVALPDREDLAASVAPLEGAARAGMCEALPRAAAHVRPRLADPARFVEEGLARLRLAIGAAGSLSDEEAALLGFDLAVIRIRDEAWSRILREQESGVALWQDLTRRIEPPFVPPVASLLGVAAWREGHGTLAKLAFERALSVDSRYSMANLLMDALCAGVGPEILKEAMPDSLDAIMGRPRHSWLYPVRALLQETGDADARGDGAGAGGVAEAA